MTETMESLRPRPASPDVPLLSIRDVSYSYETGLHVLENTQIDIDAGQILAIIGPSGCGKSTLLRLIAGLAKPTSGSIVKAEGALGGRAPLTMVFQNDILLPWLTVEENAALYSKFMSRRERKKDRAEREDRIASLIDLVGLSAFRDAYPYQMSGGMRRRLAFIAAVAPQPRILLLDEPFASVDEPTRIQIHQDILQIIRRLDMAVVIVTHDLAEAASIADDVLVMTARPGRVFSHHHVPFGAERDVMALRQAPEFLELYGQLWRDLGVQFKSDDQRPERTTS